MQPTQRTYRNVITGYYCRLYTSQDNSKYHLIYEGNTDPSAPAEGSEVNGFYLAAHTGLTIKTNKGNQVYIPSGEFYNLQEGEHATHRRFVGFNKFSKI